jgi:uncharacterized membrane protein
MDLIVAFVFAVGRVICHQQPERSFFLDGDQFPVCARCTGLYISAAAGLAGWVAVKAASRWRRLSFDPRLAIRMIVIGGIPTAVSLGTGLTAVWDGSNAIRALLAVPLGASAGAIVAAVATKDLR